MTISYPLLHWQQYHWPHQQSPSSLEVFLCPQWCVMTLEKFCQHHSTILLLIWLFFRHSFWEYSRIILWQQRGKCDMEVKWCPQIPEKGIVKRHSLWTIHHRSGCVPLTFQYLSFHGSCCHLIRMFHSYYCLFFIFPKHVKQTCIDVYFLIPVQPQMAIIPLAY